MFKAKINVDVLKECIDVIRAINDDAVLNISAGGWGINVVDPANVALVSFELDRNAFSDFQFKLGEPGEDKIKIGVDFATLDRMLDTDIIEKEVELELDEQPEQKNLFVKVDIFEYTLSLNDPSSFREPKLPKMNFSAHAIIETDKFIRSIHAAEKIDDHATFAVEEEMLYLKVKDERNERNTLKSALSENVTKDPGKLHSTHSLEYLSAMAKAIRTENVALELNNDYPLSIDFKMAEGQGKVMYLLAPRIQPE